MEYTPSQIDARIQHDPEMQRLAKDDETEFLAQHEKIYNSFGYNHDGSPMSRAMKGMQKASEITGIPRDYIQTAANIPIPAALSVAGAIGGARLGPGGVAAGASMGSVEGEHLNYALGLRDAPGTVDNLVAAGGPLLGPLASRMKSPVSNALQSLPGAGQHMHNIANEQLKKQLAYMDTSDEMVNMMRSTFKSVPSFKTDVPMVRDLLKQELNEKAKSLSPDSPYITKLNETIKNMSGKKSFSFEQLMATERDFINKGAEDSTGVWKKLSGTLISDLEIQASNPKLTQATRAKILQGVESYKNYVAVKQRHTANTTLDGFLNGSVKQLDDGLVRFNKPYFLKQLDSEGMQIFEPSEREAIKKSIADIGYIGASPNSFTSGAIHTGSLGAVGLAAYSVGGVKGIVAATAALTALRIGLGSDMGRKFITKLAKDGHGKIDGAELSSGIGKLVAGMSSGAVAGVSGMGTRTMGMPQTSTETNPVQSMENQQ